jgi:integral membrane sensor domain MASE1
MTRTSGSRSWVIAGVVVAGYVTSVLFSLLIGRAGGPSATVWTANGFLAGGFILLARRPRALVAALCLAAQVGVSLAIGDALVRAVLFPLINVGEAALCAWLAVRFCGARARRLSLRELVLIPLGAIAPAAVAAALVGGVANLLIFHQNLLHAWAAWAGPSSFGMVIVLPALLLATRVRQYPEFRRPLWEIAAISVGLLALTAALLLQPGMPLQFLIYPALTFVAFRLGPPGAAIAGAVVALISLPVVLLSDAGAASGWALEERVALAELAIAALLFTTLATAGALADQLRLKRLMLWRDQAARAARIRARTAERLAAEALEAARARAKRGRSVTA